MKKNKKTKAKVEELKNVGGVYIQHTDLYSESSLEGFEMNEKISNFGNTRNLIHFIRTHTVYNILSKNTPENGKVIDIGCGYAEIASLSVVDGKKFTYYGLDADIKKLSKVAKKTVGKFKRVLIQCDMSRADLPFDDNSIDTAILVEALEHINKERGIELLKEIKRVLKKNGTLVLITPNVEFKKGTQHSISEHIYEWNFKELKNEIDKCGYEIEYSFGLLFGENIRNVDKKYIGSELYDKMRKILPNAFTKSILSLDSPEQSRHIGFVCKNK